MKNLYKILIVSLLSISTFAQQATEIDPKFVKLPRYADLAAIGAAIPSPTQGTMVYNIDTKTNWYYNGILWVNTVAGTVPAPLNLTRTTAGVVGDCTICGERITNGDPLNPVVDGGYGVMGTASGSQTAFNINGAGVYGIGLGYNYGVKGYSDNSYGVIGNSSGGVGGYFSGTYALETSGIIKFAGSGVGTPAAGKVLTTLDNSGYATWQDIIPYTKTLDETGSLLNLTNIGLGNTGYFRINNSSNNANAVEARTLGSGNAIYGFAQGTAGHAANFESVNSFSTLKSTNHENGNAGTFEINNINSGGHTLLVNTNGLGRSGWFQSTNTSNNAATLIAENHGSGQAVYGTNFGGGKAGVFEINNGSNSNIALHAITNGTGKAAYFQGTNALETNGTIKFGGSGVGAIAAGKVLTSDALGGATWQDIPAVAAPLVLTSTSTTLNSAATGPTGNAAYFKNYNTANSNDAVYIETTGSGSAIQSYNSGTGTAGNFIIFNALNAASAIEASTNGTGRGAIFSIQNATNASNALYATTNGTGKAAYFQGTNALETNGTIKFAGSGVGTITAGKVLTSDASGGATWQAIPAVVAPLSLSSTATTLTATSTVGTAANFSSTSGYALIAGSGNVGIGTPTPTAKLHVFTTATGTEATFSENNGTGNAIGVKGSVTNVAASGVGVLGTHVGAGKGVQGESNSGIGGYFSSTSGYALITGTGNVGIGTNTPTAKLEVTGQVKIQDGTQGASKILSSDANGLASWQELVPYSKSATNASTLLGLTNTGTGKAGEFVISNASNSNNALNAITNGTGNAFYATNSSSTVASARLVNSTNLGNAVEIEGGIKVSGTNKAAFKITTNTAGGGNTSGNILTIPNTTLANNINDILIVTHNYSPNNTYLNKAYGVFWNNITSNWAIYLEDTSAMPHNVTFNVLVIKQ